MSAPAIGAVLILPKFQTRECGGGGGALQKPPKALIAELGEIANSILNESDRRTLGSADSGGDYLVNSLAGLHETVAGSWVLFIWSHLYDSG